MMVPPPPLYQPTAADDALTGLIFVAEFVVIFAVLAFLAWFDCIRPERKQ